MAKIGVVGYYGWGNYGDELFLDVYRQFLAPHELIVLPEITRHPFFRGSVKDRVDEVDAILIGGGDLIIPWSLSGLYWKPEYLAKPVFVFGVGVPTWGGHKEEIVQRMAQFLGNDQVKSVTLRDPESRDWVARHIGCADKLSWSPDPVCSLKLEEPSKRYRKPVFSLVLRAHQNIQPHHVQSICDWAGARGFHVRQLVLGTGATGKDDFAEASNHPFVPGEIVLRDSISGLTAELLQSDMIASMKFHGCVVGCMAGIPTIALSKADKFRSFYRLLGQDGLAPIMAPDLIEVADRIADGFDSSRAEDIQAQSAAGLEALREHMDRVLT